MRHHRGGGALVSVAGSEIFHQHVSNAFSYVGGKFSEWFKSTEQSSAPQQQTNNQVSWENFTGVFTGIYSTVKEFFETWVKSMQKDLKDLGNLYSKNSQQQSQEITIPSIEWRVFFNGLFTLCHFMYRDVFRVKFGTLFYLLLGLLLDTKEISQWKWNKESFLKVYKNFNQEKRFEKALAGFLSMLIQLDMIGKFTREIKTKMSSQGDQNHQQYSPFYHSTLIPVDGRNLQWAAYSLQWVLDSTEKK
ncbi:hypothetical protein MSUIS_06890 [Mycoplasma suis KI3806]|uniref:Uncharacterized protein n=1 Tax=Mycoplasma suis (strain KI_3806) TaxID=708248 RepID=F0V2A1_MYCS3|nr:hypothetical protein [Mycoplasma suis]CBZ40782.1 hypothetical protein MSUIS_06890 [Mycoplasma suis KI3806]